MTLSALSCRSCGCAVHANVTGGVFLPEDMLAAQRPPITYGDCVLVKPLGERQQTQVRPTMILLPGCCH
jgi:hypothetical protein